MGSTDIGAKTDKDLFLVGFHAVAFFDLLGQANALAALGTKIPSELSKPELIDLLKQTYARVQKFRNTFKQVFEGLSEVNRDPSRFGVLTEEQKRTLESMVPPKTNYFGFSDSFVASVFLADFHTKVPVLGVY